MGLFGSLFGCDKKADAPKAKCCQSAVVAQPAVAGGIPAEVIAAISASVGIMMDDASADMVAAIAAAIVHSRGGSSALRIKRTGNAWAASGLQKVMDCRQQM